MKKNIINFSIASLLIAKGITAQETIELKTTTSGVPTTYDQIILANGYTNANAATVDLFAKNTKDVVSIPNNYVGSQDADKGDNYFGIITYMQTGSFSLKKTVESGLSEFTDDNAINYGEYIQTALPAAMAAGKEYNITFKVSLADYSAFATTGWGVLLSDKQLSEPTNKRLTMAPTVAISDFVKDKNAWTTLSAKFKATGNEKYLIIGCFMPGYKVEKVEGGKAAGINKAYYYVSSISFKEVAQDKDKDGILDKDDKCPDVAGLASLQGCPDSDNDGITDADDKCPTTAGLAKFNGCPDTDGDGITDAEDKCPTVAGIAHLKGCPEIKVDEKAKQVFQKAMKGIQFETGKDVIKKSSYPILDNVVTVLKENPSWSVVVEGYTDNVGKPEANKTLSNKRAAAVEAYLESKGVDSVKLTSAGYGQENPIASNKTAAGRAENRRVEFKVTYEQ